ncbi:MULTISPECIES: FtsK/SpoIIIE family DNA translocase [Clostridium]|uniref:DNA translocase FtsK n=2 Tax=Clostridium TaxID=1485 RepID=A0A151AQF8_9CLOT|nr:MULTISPECIES: DNA translocase FtsK [Clostridium]MBE6079028.1 DNA translocase FtsK [Clostridium lundense]KYH29874.1 DNA translocase FtsK [Clostridium colicanis DSM 13634]MBE6042671.1 DNA translocase FtsK [Clostridium thermopalmarium]PRR75255.1 DNA translocase FtsK [Clostridium thermopalmarium DSM 5974]PVZ28011.1 S-DNA-T family DNA segregation ATPase FtsK/SpoIIIE [Clostridium thermopalmarium DSM 5974]
MVKKNAYSKSNISNDIKGIIFMTIGILMLLSVFATNSSGLMGKTVKKFLFSLIGLGAYFFPLLLILVGISFIIKKGKIIFNKRFYGIMTLLINSLMFIQMIYIKQYYTEGSWILGIHKIYNKTDHFHGGILIYLIDIPLYKLFGDIGSYIIFISIYIIAGILIMQISINELFYMFKLDKILIEKIKGKSIIKNKNKENQGKEEEKSSLIKDLNSKVKIINFLKSAHNIENLKTNEESGKEIKILEPKIVDTGFNTNIVKKSNSSQADKEVYEEINKQLNNELNQKYNNCNKEYVFPPLQLLNHSPSDNHNKNSKKELINNATKLEETLASFGVNAKVIQVTKGPSVTRFELQPSSGVKVSKITHLSDDIALSLAASSVRIEAPIPGKSAVGIEVPNKIVSPVYLREVIESNEFKNFNKNIAFAVGKDIAGNCIVSDLSKMPHLLIAGATGSGKSVCINTLIISLLYKYSSEDVKLLLVDPKVVELNVYNGIPHLLIPVVTNPKKAAGALNWAVTEMTRRYNLFAENNVRNIEGFNELFNKGKIKEKLPWIIIIIDELADLMMVSPGEVEEYIARLAQMARAAGMHLVIATQRPSVDVITGVIKANIPSRISFAVSSQVDSRTIIDSAGAEKLLGKGDMLFYPVGESKPIRIQGAFISEEEVEKVVNFIKSQNSEIKYEESIINEINAGTNKKENEGDELIDEAIQIVIETGQASTSLLQRKLRIGYNRAARLIDEMETRGVISGRNGSKPRQVLVDTIVESDN